MRAKESGMRGLESYKYQIFQLATESTQFEINEGRENEIPGAITSLSVNVQAILLKERSFP